MQNACHIFLVYLYRTPCRRLRGEAYTHQITLAFVGRFFALSETAVVIVILLDQRQ